MRPHNAIALGSSEHLCQAAQTGCRGSARHGVRCADVSFFLKTKTVRSKELRLAGNPAGATGVRVPLPPLRAAGPVGATHIHLVAVWTRRLEPLDPWARTVSQCRERPRERAVRQFASLQRVLGVRRQVKTCLPKR